MVFGPLLFGGAWSSPLWWCLVLSSLVVFGPLLFGGVWSSPLWWCLVLSSLVVFGPLLFGGVWSSPLWWCLVLSSLTLRLASFGTFWSQPGFTRHHRAYPDSEVGILSPILTPSRSLFAHFHLHLIRKQHQGFETYNVSFLVSFSFVRSRTRSA